MIKLNVLNYSKDIPDNIIKTYINSFFDELINTGVNTGDLQIRFEDFYTFNKNELTFAEKTLMRGITVLVGI